MPADLYAVLGVPRTATQAEIRKAYRRLARKHHPDVNPGSAEAAARFKEISAAYDALSDERRRAAYDEFGEASLRAGFDVEQARAQRAWQAGGGGGAGFQGGAGTFGGAEEGFDVDLGDLFGARFGGPGHGARSGPLRGDDLVVPVELTFVQALRGLELPVRVPGGVPCPVCHGSGQSATPCPACSGTGHTRLGQGPVRMVRTCPACGGTGRVPCPACAGSGVQPGEQTVTVRVPPGADEGTRLRVPGMGTPGRRNGPPGDLYIETHVQPHPYFRRDALDLHLTLPVTVDEAYLGTSVEVPTPEGPVQLKIPPRSQSGRRLRLRGRGVRRGGRAGDLYVELSVRVPDRSEEDATFAACARNARALYERPVREGISL